MLRALKVFEKGIPHVLCVYEISEAVRNEVVLCMSQMCGLI